MSELKVLVVGTGLGGLTLAQGLRDQDVEVVLVERDSSPWDRPQGYRLHLDADARNAAREVMTDDLWAVFEATSCATETHTTMLGTDLSVIRRIPTDDQLDDRIWPGRNNIAGHVNVDRATLRQILLAGLDDRIHYGRTFERYEDTGDGVTAHFSDGTTEHGDVLVGADGVRSAVRRQRAPRCDTVDAGITAIYGRIPMTIAGGLLPSEVLSDIFTISIDEQKRFLGLGAVRFPTRPAEAAARHAPGMAMVDQDDYVVVIVGGRHEYFPALRDGVRRDPAELQHIAADTLAGWPTAATDVGVPTLRCATAPCWRAPSRPSPAAGPTSGRHWPPTRRKCCATASRWSPPRPRWDSSAWPRTRFGVGGHRQRRRPDELLPP